MAKAIGYDHSDHIHMCTWLQVCDESSLAADCWFKVSADVIYRLREDFLLYWQQRRSGTGQTRPLNLFTPLRALSVHRGLYLGFRV